MTNDIQPAPQRGRLIARTDAAPGDCPTNLDLGTEEGKASFLNALCSPDVVLDKDGRAYLSVVHYVAHPAEHVDADSGELRQYSRLVLIQEDGTTFATTSAVVAHRLAQALALYGPGPISPPLNVVVMECRSKAGRRYHDLRFEPRR